MSKYLCKSCIAIIRKRIKHIKDIQKKHSTQNNNEQNHIITQLEYLIEINTK